LRPAAAGIGGAHAGPAGHRAAVERALPRGRAGARVTATAGLTTASLSATADLTAMAEFTLPAELEAHAPPEARGLTRDGVRMLVSRAASGTGKHHRFTDLAGLLLPGEFVVVNTTRTLPAAVRSGPGLTGHFSTARA